MSRAVRRALAVALLIILRWSAVTADTLQATAASFPGLDGRIASTPYSPTLSDGNQDIWTMRPDGSGLTNITHSPGIDELDAQGSPFILRASSPRGGDR
jgi:hypothetical protein